MRGDDQQQSGMFSYISAEQPVPQGHPLRALRTMADEALAELSPRFSRLYAKRGRPSIAPEKCCERCCCKCCTPFAVSGN